MIEITSGDTNPLRFVAKSNGVPIVLTGAQLVTSILGTGGAVRSIPNGQHVINPDQVNFPGQFSLSLLTADYTAIGTGFEKDVLTTSTIGSSVTTLRGQGVLTIRSIIPAT